MRLNIIVLSITLLLISITSTEGAKLEHMDLRQADLKGCTWSAMDKCYSTLPPDGTAPNTLVEEIGQVDGPQKCQAFCKDLYSNTCTWFMYDRTTKDCKLFSGSLDDLRADCNEIGYPRAILRFLRRCLFRRQWMLQFPRRLLPIRVWAS